MQLVPALSQSLWIFKFHLPKCYNTCQPPSLCLATTSYEVEVVDNFHRHWLKSGSKRVWNYAWLNKTHRSFKFMIVWTQELRKQPTRWHTLPQGRWHEADSYHYVSHAVQQTYISIMSSKKNILYSYLLHRLEFTGGGEQLWRVHNASEVVFECLQNLVLDEDSISHVLQAWI